MMTIMQMRLFQGDALDTKIQELGAKKNAEHYALSIDDGKYILSVSTKKKSKDSEVSQAFWHFFSLHERYLKNKHIQSLVEIHLHISFFQVSDFKDSTIQKIEHSISNIFLPSIGSIEDARGFVPTLDSYMREERFSLVGTILAKLLSSETHHKQGFTLVSNLMSSECRKKMPQVFAERAITSFGCITYSQYCDSLAAVMDTLCQDLERLHIGWGNRVEHLIDQKICPRISKQTKLKELLIGTPEVIDSKPSELALPFKQMSSLKSLHLYHVCLKNQQYSILDDLTVEHLTIVDNVFSPIIETILSTKKIQDLHSLHLEGLSEYKINNIAWCKKLEKLVVIPMTDQTSVPGTISLPDINELTQLTELTLYGDGFDSFAVKQLAQSLTSLTTLEIKTTTLTANALSNLLSHPTLKNLRITVDGGIESIPDAEPKSCAIETLSIRIDTIFQDIDLLAEYIKKIPSIKYFSLASDSCSQKTYGILASKTPSFETLYFLFSARKPLFTSSHNYATVFYCRDLKPKQYRHLMITWHEPFPLTM
jgi:hypothetical protein